MACTTSPSELGFTIRIFRSLAEGKALGQARGKPGIEDFFLRGGDIVLEASQFDGAFVHVVNDVGSFGIIVARLADRADVYKILFAGLDFEFRIGASADHAVANESN